MEVCKKSDQSAPSDISDSALVVSLRFSFKARLICRRLLAVELRFSFLKCANHQKLCQSRRPINPTEAIYIFRLQPLVAANLLAALMAPADGELELPRHTSLIIRTSKNEQFVFFAIRQIAGVGVKGGGISALRSHLDFSACLDAF